MAPTGCAPGNTAALANCTATRCGFSRCQPTSRTGFGAGPGDVLAPGAEPSAMSWEQTPRQAFEGPGRSASARIAAASSPILITLRSSRFLGTVRVRPEPISALAARAAATAWVSLALSLLLSSESLPMPIRVAVGVISL